MLNDDPLLNEVDGAARQLGDEEKVSCCKVSEEVVKFASDMQKIHGFSDLEILVMAADPVACRESWEYILYLADTICEDGNHKDNELQDIIIELGEIIHEE